jgi:Protein of unknown function (DUF3223)
MKLEFAVMPNGVNLSNGRTWPTQAAALDHFRQLMARYADGEMIDDTSDYADLLALLVRYDATVTDGPSKIGVGVRAFERRRNDYNGYASSGFWVRRVDGSETDFSFVQAVRGRPRQQGREFYEACRVAVAEDLRIAKRTFFDTYEDAFGRVACELSSQLIAFNEAQIDHADPTFRQLVDTFRAARGWRCAIPPGVLTAPADKQTETRFVDPNIANAFREFHKVALLRVVAAEVNSAMATQQRRPRVSRPVVLP